MFLPTVNQIVIIKTTGEITPYVGFFRVFSGGLCHGGGEKKKERCMNFGKDGSREERGLALLC